MAQNKRNTFVTIGPCGDWRHITRGTPGAERALSNMGTEEKSSYEEDWTLIKNTLSGYHKEIGVARTQSHVLQMRCLLQASHLQVL